MDHLPIASSRVVGVEAWLLSARAETTECPRLSEGVSMVSRFQSQSQIRAQMRQAQRQAEQQFRRDVRKAESELKREADRAARRWEADVKREARKIDPENEAAGKKALSQLETKLNSEARRVQHAVPGRKCPTPRPEHPDLDSVQTSVVRAEERQADPA